MNRIFLDYNSTTPLDPLVLEKMLPWFSEKFGNEASKNHSFGWEAEEIVKIAREQIANVIGAESSEIIFTSGATEAINLAIRGLMQTYAKKGKHIISCMTEHKAVIDTIKDLDCDVTWLKMDREGNIDLIELENAIRKDTVMVCLMMANNETGTIHDVEKIGKICLEKETIFFSDITQAVGKVKVNVKEKNIALAALSAHKFYGPKGVGALYISRKNPRVTLHAQITGGGHEKNLRSGTLNVPGIVGMGEAIQLADKNVWDYAMHTSKLRTFLEQSIQENNKNVFINGSIKNRLPNTTNIRINGVKSEKLIQELYDIAISTGSACSSALPEPSHVLSAMGLNDAEVFESFRVSLGKSTTLEEINYTIEKINSLIKSS